MPAKTKQLDLNQTSRSTDAAKHGLTVKLWKNVPKRKRVSISSTVSPEGLVDMWNNIPNMGNLKTSAVSEVTSMRASRCLRMSLEAGATPFRLLSRKGYQVIEAEVSL